MNKVGPTVRSPVRVGENASVSDTVALQATRDAAEAFVSNLKRFHGDIQQFGMVAVTTERLEELCVQGEELANQPEIKAAMESVSASASGASSQESSLFGVAADIGKYLNLIIEALGEAFSNANLVALDNLKRVQNTQAGVANVLSCTSDLKKALYTISTAYEQGMMKYADDKQGDKITPTWNDLFSESYINGIKNDKNNPGGAWNSALVHFKTGGYWQYNISDSGKKTIDMLNTYLPDSDKIGCSVADGKNVLTINKGTLPNVFKAYGKLCQDQLGLDNLVTVPAVKQVSDLSDTIMNTKLSSAGFTNSNSVFSDCQTQINAIGTLATQSLQQSTSNLQRGQSDYQNALNRFLELLNFYN